MGTNVGWLLLVSPFDCDLTFEIIPVDTSADFSFSLYKYRKGIHANLLLQEGVQIMSDRQNATPNISNKGVIGLSMLAKEKNLTYDQLDRQARPYSRFIEVNSGDSLLLGVGVYRNKEITDPFYFRIKYHNKSFRLNNVLFETNKTDLLPGSFIELNKLAVQLKEKPSMQIEIRGHTDNVGEEGKNKALSEGRAKAVYDYLLVKGIDKSRIAYKGFGSKKAVAKNDTEEGRKKNRRVEMVIIKE